MKSTVNIREEVKQDAKKYAKSNGYKLSDFVTIAVKNELERRRKGCQN